MMNTLKFFDRPIRLCRCTLQLNSKSFSSSSSGTSSGPIKMSYTSIEATSVLHSQESPIIIMHGLLGSKTNWNSIAKAINAKTKRKVISVDARNHGESPHTSEMSYDDLASDVLQLMQDLEMPKATLIGHSMGGRTMMKVALNRPEVVDSLVVVDVSPINVSPSIVQLRHYVQAMQNVQIDPHVPRSSARKVADDQIKDVVEDYFVRQFLITNLVESESGGYKWRVNLECIARTLDNIAAFPYSDLSRYEGETLFIGGAKSDYIKVSDHEAIRGLFPRALFRYIPGAGHWVHSEKTTDFLQVLLNFLLKRTIPPNYPTTLSST